MRERTAREASTHVETARHETEALTEEPAHERYVGGEIPPPSTSTASHGATASSMAYADASDDKNVEELKRKVGALVDAKFGGDMKKAFEHYAGGADGVSKGELVQLLSDAGVGSGLTRGIWASKIIDKLDAGGDGKIQWNEFESVFRARA